nr:hypothetical protein BaRGS_009050 [Batillaria attramentaria]
MGTNGIPTRVRKISIQPGQTALRESLSDRLEDLMGAIMWVKQELIMLRQHDILLKRQFFNIQDSIQSLQKHKPTTSSSSTSSANSNPHATSNGSAEPTTNGHDSQSSDASAVCNGTASPRERHSVRNERIPECDEGYFPETFLVRPSSSVTMLHEESEEEEDDDTFCEDFFMRPRTSSMRTSRDMAALARRRGSKELI